MLYNIILFLHIIGAILMFIAIGITLIAMIAMIRSKKVSTMQIWATLAVKMDGLLPLSVLLILVPGLYLVFTAWGWNLAWVNVSLITILLMTVMGPVINLRRLKSILNAVNEETEQTSVPSGVLMAKAKDRVLWNSVSIMTMLAFGIVFLMTVKVGFMGSMLTIAVSVLVGLVAATVLLGGTAGVNVSKKTGSLS